MRSAFGIAYHVLQHREDAEDAVQQALIAALARLDTFDATRPFGPWISRVVLNHARSARRARTRLVAGGSSPWKRSRRRHHQHPIARPDVARLESACARHSRCYRSGNDSLCS